MHICDDRHKSMIAKHAVWKINLGLPAIYPISQGPRIVQASRRNGQKTPARGARINLIMTKILCAPKFIIAEAASICLVGLAILLCANTVAAANDATLYIERNDSGSVLQLIPLASWRFDSAGKILTAESVFGGLDCGGKLASKTSSSYELVLDGKAYAVDRIVKDTIGNIELIVQPAGGGLFPLCLNDSLSLTTAKGAASLKLEFQDLDGFGTSTARTLRSGSTIGFNPAAALATALQDDSNATLVCFVPLNPSLSFPLRMNLRDSNGVYEEIAGIASLAYLPFGQASTGTPANTMRINAVDGLFCVPLPVASSQRDAEDEQDFEMAQCPVKDVVFRVGFEDDEDTTGGQAAADLILDLRLDAAPSTITPQADDPMRYEIYVKNCSNTQTATNVRIRDFFPVNRGNVNPVDGLLKDLPVSDLICRVNGDNRDCIADVIEDPVTNGNPALPYLSVNIGSLGPGKLAQISITREAVIPNGLPSLRLNAAVISDVVETNTDNNGGSWTVDFVNSNNLAPTVVIEGEADNLTEDDPAILVTGITIQAADDDGTVVSVAVTSTNQSLIANSGISVTGLSNITVTVTPVADAFGTVMLSVIATDDKGRESAAKNFDLTIDSVNDPPSITVKGGFDFNGGALVFNGPVCSEDSLAGCANQLYPSTVGVLNSVNHSAFLNWVVSVSPGPANESGQTATATVSLQTDETPSLFLGGDFEPKLPSGTSNLNFGLSGKSGTAKIRVTVDDGQGPGNNSSSSFEFFMVIENAAPVVTDNQSFDVSENSANGTVVETVVGTDAEGFDLVDWMIVSGNMGIDDDGKDPFAINPGTGEITVNDVDDLDFERVPQYVLGITVSDGTVTSATESVTINVTNVDEAAVAVTDAASSVSDVAATLNGAVTPNDNDSVATTVSFEYGTDTDYGKTTAAASRTGSLPVAVSAALTGLGCNTEYHYRVTITNTLGTENGDDESFTTLSCATASISGLAVNSITGQSATISGLVDPNGSDTAVIFRYGIGFNLSETDSAVPATIFIADGETEVSAELTGLTCDKTYNFVIEATNGGGSTTDDQIKSFKTTTDCSP